MPSTLINSAPAARIAARPLFERLVLQLLSRMDQGYLRLTLPDGETLTLGHPESDIQADIHIRRSAFFRKCVLYGDVGFGEAFVDGDWDSPDVTAVISWMILNIEKNPSMSGSKRRFSPVNVLQTLNRLYHRLRPNTVKGSRRNIAAHYDLSNDFFQIFLDPSMMYSSAYFSRPGMSLEEAQREKLDKLCQSLQLKSTDHLLEIGTGWGGLAIHAAKNYGARVTTVTISKAQYAFAMERVRAAGLSDRITILLEDYRHLRGQYDKMVSVEMLEAVGHEHLPAYFQQCHKLLKPEGLLALQVITCPDGRYESLRKGVDWIQKHIFPGSLLPSLAALQSAVNATGDMILHRLETINEHYVQTLSAWRDNLNAHREAVLALGFDQQTLRKWNYYFSYCEAAFGMRNIAVVQMLYTRPNNRSLNP